MSDHQNAKGQTEHQSYLPDKSQNSVPSDPVHMDTGTLEQFTLPSSNHQDHLHVYWWKPAGEVKAVLQVTHGMDEYLMNYTPFAEYLNAHGIAVIGNDDIGHGQTAPSLKDLGLMHAPQLSQTVVKDMETVTRLIQSLYPGVPIVLLGHSMGSFMARRYDMEYGKNLSGLILMGTGSQPNALLPAARTVLKDLIKLKGPDYRPVELMDLGEKILNIQFGKEKDKTAVNNSGKENAGKGSSKTKSCTMIPDNHSSRNTTKNIQQSRKTGFLNQRKEAETSSAGNKAETSSSGKKEEISSQGKITETTSAENWKMTEALARLSYLTSDPEKLKAFLEDPHDGFIYSLEGLLVVVDVLQYIQKSKNIKKMPVSVSILMVSGREDPVGHDGKDVITLAKQYDKMGIPVQVQIYEGMRHQILDERDPLPVYRDITRWILSLPDVQDDQNKRDLSEHQPY